MERDDGLTGGLVYGEAQRRHSPILYAAPMSLPHESPCSWIQRLCSAHGYSLHRIAAVLRNTPKHHDWDRFSQSSHWGEVVQATGLEQPPCEQARLGIQRMLWTNKRHWMFDKSTSGPHYQWCPICLGNDQTPYLRWFWRYGWLDHCPFHRVKLQWKCHGCTHQMILNRTMLLSFYGRLGVPDLSHCGACGLALGAAVPRGAHKNFQGSFVSTDTIHSMIQAGEHRRRQLWEDERDFRDQEWQQERARHLLTQYQSPAEIRLFEPSRVDASKSPEPVPKKVPPHLIRDPERYIPLRSQPLFRWLGIGRIRPNPDNLNAARPGLPLERVRVRWNTWIPGNYRMKMAEALAMIRKEKNMYRSRGVAPAPATRADGEEQSDEPSQ